MGMFARMKEKASSLLGEHSDKARQGTEKAGNFIDEKTGGKYTDKIDKAQDKASDVIDQQSEQKKQDPGTQ